MAVAEGQPFRQNPAYRPAGIFFRHDVERWHALLTSRRLVSEGMRRGAGRVGPFSLVVADAAFAAPRERTSAPLSVWNGRREFKGVVRSAQGPGMYPVLQLAR
jgi:hypothetical protein